MSADLSAIELLHLGDCGRKKPWANYYWSEILGVTLGVTAGTFINYQTRRPAFSGITKHIFISVALTATLKYVNKIRDEYYQEKDAVYRDYIDLHQADFPCPERRKIGQILEPWIPIR